MISTEPLPITHLALAVEHEGGADDLLSVDLAMTQVMLAVAVEDLLSFLDGVLGHEVGLKIM